MRTHLTNVLSKGGVTIRGIQELNLKNYPLKYDQKSSFKEKKIEKLSVEI